VPLRPRRGHERTTFQAVARLALLAALATFVSSLPPAAQADDATTTTAAGDAFTRANAADAAGRSAEAADAFAATARDRGSSPEVLLNLGNASARAGRIGEAILAWERALVLDPGNPEVSANLRALRRRANLPEAPDDAWSRLVARFGADGWARIGSGAWLAGWLFLLAAALAGDRLSGRPTLRRLVRLALPSAFALVALSVLAERSALADLERAVVLGDGGGLRAAPFASAPQGQAVVAGEIVLPEREHEGWILVTTAAGKSGWLESSRAGRTGEMPGPSTSGD
jgi:tetratricopeptide (TPR) repeat protein